MSSDKWQQALVLVDATSSASPGQAERLSQYVGMASRIDRIE